MKLLYALTAQWEPFRLDLDRNLLASIQESPALIFCAREPQVRRVASLCGNSLVKGWWEFETPTSVQITLNNCESQGIHKIILLDRYRIHPSYSELVLEVEAYCANSTS